MARTLAPSGTSAYLEVTRAVPFYIVPQNGRSVRLSTDASPGRNDGGVVSIPVYFTANSTVRVKAGNDFDEETYFDVWELA